MNEYIIVGTYIKSTYFFRVWGFWDKISKGANKKKNANRKSQGWHPLPYISTTV